MDLRIKTMTLQNFKGVSNKTYNLDKSVANLTGINGSGKTTVLDAIMWLFANKDYARKHNPIVSTIGNEMADTTVTMSILMVTLMCSKHNLLHILQYQVRQY